MNHFNTTPVYSAIPSQTIRRLYTTLDVHPLPLIVVRSRTIGPVGWLNMDGSFQHEPVPMVNGWDDTDSVAIGLKSVVGGTTFTLTFLGTPVSDKTYRIQAHLL